MLDLTLATRFRPGTNVEGDVPGANWLFLLPTMEAGRVVCIGEPTACGLSALARAAREVLVCAESPTLSPRDSNVRVVADLGSVPDASVAVVVIACRDDMATLTRGMPPSELQRVLRPDGVIYLEQRGFDKGVLRKLSAATGAQPRRFWLTPLGGELHSAIPASDRVVAAYFEQHDLVSSSFDLRKVRRAVLERGTAISPVWKVHGVRSGLTRVMRNAVRWLFHAAQDVLHRMELRVRRTPVFGGLTRRYGVLLAPGDREAGFDVPRYLREAARNCGVSIEGYRWGLSASGTYRSRKILFFLFPPNCDRPEYVVKMTRDPSLNRRLENEHRSLRQLVEMGICDGVGAPRPVFFGYHNGLAILGESAVPGAEFEDRSNGTADCPLARKTLESITALGVATADRTIVSPSAAADVLAALWRQFADIYPLTPRDRVFMDGQLAAIASSPGAFPVVFQHGDSGTWNLKVTPDDQVAFLDWEGAEAHGVPLWDLLHFVFTCANRTKPSDDIALGFIDRFRNDRAFSALLTDAVHRYAERIDLPPEMIEPLFYTCWVHRGLKEAMRLKLENLARGRYCTLLRAAIEHRDRLTPLFAAASPNERSSACSRGNAA